MRPYSVGWFRVYFHAPEKELDQPSLLVPPVSGADEIYLNGERIGGEGSIGENFFGAPKVQRLCKIPRDLLRHGEDNVLAVRVMAGPTLGGRLHRMLLGEYGQLVVEKLNRDSRQKEVEILFLMFAATILFISIANVISGALRISIGIFAVFVGLYGLMYLFNSLIFFESGLKTHLVQKLMYVVTIFIPVSIPVLLAYSYGRGLSAYLKGLVLATVLLALTAFFFLSPSLWHFTGVAWFLLIIGCSVEAMRLGVRAWRSGVHESGTILVGLTCILAAGLISGGRGLGVVHPIWVYGDSLPVLVAGPCFMLARITAFIQEFVRLRKERAVLARRILDANEIERARLARELHDGVGQSLLAIKLNLKMLEASVKEGVPIDKEVFPGLIAEISNSIEELRNVAMELRPAFFEKLGIVDAIKWYGRRFEEHTGIKVVVRAEEPVQLSQGIKDHVYRICQEAFTNVLKHASAESVEVRVETEPGVLSVTISDDGKGFEPAKAEAVSKGLGLSTMTERAELL